MTELKDLEFDDVGDAVQFLFCVAKDDKNPLQAEAQSLLDGLKTAWVKNTRKNMPSIDYSDPKWDE